MVLKESRIVRVSIPGTQRQFGNWLNQNLEGIISMSGVEKDQMLPCWGGLMKRWTW